MANKGLSMRKVREVLRLHHVTGLSGRAIARSLKLSPTTVKRYIVRAEVAGLSWPLPESLDDAQLERRLLPGAVSMPGEARFAVPDWSRVHRELRRKTGNVTNRASTGPKQSEKSATKKRGIQHRSSRPG